MNSGAVQDFKLITDPHLETLPPDTHPEAVEAAVEAEPAEAEAVEDHKA